MWAMGACLTLGSGTLETRQDGVGVDFSGQPRVATVAFVVGQLATPAMVKNCDDSEAQGD
jgi:hypothetical protein